MILSLQTISRVSSVSRFKNPSVSIRPYPWLKLWDGWDGRGTALGRVKIQNPSVKCGLGRWDGSKGGYTPPGSVSHTKATERLWKANFGRSPVAVAVR